jgi:hypothetical protein
MEKAYRKSNQESRADLTPFLYFFTLNNLREYRIQNMGTRAIIESMVNAEVPDLSDDHLSHCLNKSNQKVHMLSILSEICPEFVVQSL